MDHSSHQHHEQHAGHGAETPNITATIASVAVDALKDLHKDVDNFFGALESVDNGGSGNAHGDHHGHHGHHDHSAHAAASTAGGDHSGHHMMKMWFHGGFEEVILFDFWRISSLQGMLLSCALIFIMGAAYEGLKWGRVHLQTRLTRTVTPLSKRRLVHFVLPSLYVLQLVLAYWLMLIVMTYNNYLTAAVILGAGLGHWIFAVLQPFENGEMELAQDACH